MLRRLNQLIIQPHLIIYILEWTTSDLVRYLPGLVKAAYQGQIKSIETKRKHTDNTYKDLEVIEFPIILTKNHYTNFQNIHLYFL